jgi:ABC-type transport system substrate-binding protein
MHEGLAIAPLASSTNTVVISSKDPADIRPSVLDFKVVGASTDESEVSLTQATVGSGPYKVVSIQEDQNKIIKEVTFGRFANSSINTPYIKYITIVLYGNSKEAQDDFINKKIDFVSSVADVPFMDQVKQHGGIVASTSSTSENFVVFINQKNNENLKVKEFRKYLNNSIDRQKLTTTLFPGLAEPVSHIAGTGTISNSTTTNQLEKAGFILGNGVLYVQTKESKQDSKKPVTLELLTVNTTDMQKTAEFLAQEWKQKGIDVTIKTIEKNELPDALKEKNFDLLLFGFNVASNDGYYSFFHSSQTGFPKLNISSYASKKVDTIVTSLKSTTDTQKTQELLLSLAAEMDNDIPVIFLYKPVVTSFYYGSRLTPVLPASVTHNNDVYQNTESWYVEKERVFKFMNESKLTKILEMYIN